MNNPPALIDRFGRAVTYLRLSVTDRCDFRCIYCMAEDMSFLPRQEVLSLEELTQVACAFAQLGVRKIRITGGEPLIRRDALTLFNNLGQLGLDDLSLTTNGARLARYAQPLADAGVHRVNISLDSLRPARFRALTRTGNLDDVLAGIQAARTAGFRRIKLNTVVMRSHNLDEVGALADFALSKGLDITYIEEMPLGVVASHQRLDEFVSSEEVRERLAPRFQLQPVADTSGGPARYYRAAGFEGRIGFISPHSHNFCGTCNRVRVSAEGRLLLCLGNEQSADLKRVMRNNPAADINRALQQAIVAALPLKPEKHHFDLAEAPQIVRFMNATGG